MPVVSPPAVLPASTLPLLAGPLSRPVVEGGQRRIDAATFLRHVHGVAAWLPDGAQVVNLCEDRYHFLVVLCAAAVRGKLTLLPPSRAPAVVAEIQRDHGHCAAIGDVACEDIRGLQYLPQPLPEADGAMPQLPAGQVVLVGFTSGSTGKPGAHAKTWGSIQASTARNRQALAELLDGPLPVVVATVPPQHMYGIEMSVMLPLLGPACVHGGRPFFPHDVARALEEVAGPRLLVTTPVHLDALVRSGIRLPPLRGIVTASAPLAAELAASAEAAFGCPVREVFGSTETCIIATRRTAREQAWTPLPGVQLQPGGEGTRISAPHLARPVLLADLMEVQADGRFLLRGRRADLLEIAGKRASLGDLTRRLLAIDGVRDGVMLQLPAEPGRAVGRIAALVVAPGLGAEQILDALRPMMDPVFLPRPLRLVDALPRNETGKLPREAVLALLQHS